MTRTTADTEAADKWYEEKKKNKPLIMTRIKTCHQDNETSMNCADRPKYCEHCQWYYAAGEKK